jgi:hypothetical protein
MAMNPRPQSYEEFLAMTEEDRPLKMHCLDCSQAFTTANVKSAAGWQETQISGICETCFDGLFEEGEK